MKIENHGETKLVELCRMSVVLIIEFFTPKNQLGHHAFQFTKGFINLFTRAESASAFRRIPLFLILLS